MPIRRRRGWELPVRQLSPEAAVLDRRGALAALGVGAGAIAAGAFGLRAAFGQGRDPIGWWEAQVANDPTRELYPASRVETYTLDRPLTEAREAITYNNFYEFRSHKGIWQAAQRLSLRPWTLTIDGLVATPRTVDIDALIRRLRAFAPRA
mgnify:FL=1